VCDAPRLGIIQRFENIKCSFPLPFQGRQFLNVMASILSGPIPQHPMFNKGVANPSPRMAPRVKPEGSSFASHGKNGTIGNLFEITGTSCFASTSNTKQRKLISHIYKKL